MTHWNYRVFTELQSTGERSFSIHEVYYDDTGRPESRTVDPVYMCAENLRELIRDTAWIIKSVSEPVLEYVGGEIREYTGPLEGFAPLEGANEKP